MTEKRVFNKDEFVNRINAKMIEEKHTISDVVRHLIKNAPDTVAPNDTQIRGILAGAVENPSASYLGLFADFVGCSVDEFYKESK